MKINYSILWIEDDQDYVDEQKITLNKYLNSLGFYLNIDSLSNGENNKDLNFSDHKYDLIIADYNLEDSPRTGDRIISLIRKNKIITEALLYTSRSDVDLKKSLQEERVSYHMGRSGLIDRIKKLISVCIRKIQDVNNMRGLVIAESIDLELKMQKILENYFSRDDKKTKEKAIKMILKKSKDYKNKLKAIDSFKPEDIQLFINEHHTAFDHYRCLCMIMKEYKKLSKTRNIINLYNKLIKMDDEIIKPRNLMAHAIEKTKNGKIFLENPANKKKITFSSSKCKTIRNNIRKHADLLNSIEQTFQ